MSIMAYLGWLMIMDPDINDNIIPHHEALTGYKFRELMEQLQGEGEGVDSVEFRWLFVRCRDCGRFKTREAFGMHNCPNEVIDLTLINE